MRTYRAVACLIVAQVLGLCQHHKLSIDPETKEGYVLQQIKQERDPSQKIKLMNDFAVEFPQSESLAWVLDQLQPVYLQARDYDKAVAIGNRILEVDADDLETAYNNLLAAEALKSPDLIRKSAAAAWTIASRLAKTPSYPKPEYAIQMIAYAEYTLAALANSEKDPRKRQEYSKALEQLNPKSQWLHSSRQDFGSLSQQGASKEKLAAAAESGLASTPDNEDMLILVADYHMQLGDNYDKVFAYASRVIDIMQSRPVPDKISAAEWEKKKEMYLGAAYYMVGVVSSLQGRYSLADKNLKSALPMIGATNEQVLGAALYHLGYANYRLAEKGERQRVFEALRYNEQCAAVKSSYREQAQKNLDSIKIEYNLR
jgi:hypothetical protein